MSRGGRWRRLAQTLRVLLLAGAVAGLGGLGWFTAGALSRDPDRVPDVARSVPLRRLELATTAGGVLDLEWLRRTLALPPTTALLELDLDALRGRLLADPQVVSVMLTRQFPDVLAVRLAERTPVARIRLERNGYARDLLVASDGVVFPGVNQDPAALAVLPWLSGFALHPAGDAFRPIPGMPAVAQLLADAQYAAMPLYRTWTSLSLARLASDREIEVQTRDGTTVVFSAARDFFVQLATLDYLATRVRREPGSRARIDLTLGRNVPVMVTSSGQAAAPSRADSRAPGRFSLDSFPQR